jgi:hypothetical protein
MTQTTIVAESPGSLLLAERNTEQTANVCGRRLPVILFIDGVLAIPTDVDGNRWSQDLNFTPLFYTTNALEYRTATPKRNLSARCRAHDWCVGGTLVNTGFATIREWRNWQTRWI